MEFHLEVRPKETALLDSEQLDFIEWLQAKGKCDTKLVLEHVRALVAMLTTVV